MRQLNDTTLAVELTNQSYVSNTLERYLTRLLRRQIFNALSEQEHDPSESYEMLVFGSAVPQRFRPQEGFEGKRLARDIDIAIRMKTPGTRPSTEDENRIANYVLEAVRATDAEIVNESPGRSRGYHGLTIAKIYTPEQIREALVGKREEAEVVVPDKPVSVPLEISNIFERSPLLPLVPLGDKGFCHEDLREVLSYKLHRMTTAMQSDSAKTSVPKNSDFKVKDLLDFYNIISSDLIDLKKDASLIRALTLVAICEDPTITKTLDNLKPTDSNVATYSRALGIDESFMRHICETVYEGIKIIFPAERSTLPPRLAGELSLTLNEFNFMMALEGIEKLPGEHGNQRIEPAVKPELIVDDDTERQYPGLRNRIANNPTLQNMARDAQNQRVIDY